MAAWRRASRANRCSAPHLSEIDSFLHSSHRFFLCSLIALRKRRYARHPHITRVECSIPRTRESKKKLPRAASNFSPCSSLLSLPRFMISPNLSPCCDYHFHANLERVNCTPSAEFAPCLYSVSLKGGMFGFFIHFTLT